MPRDIQNLPMLMQKVIDLGEIDRWLRGMADIVPKAGQKTASLSADFNRHSISFSAESHIDKDDVECMQGFRHLLTACSRRNVSLQLRAINPASIEVFFDPDKDFCKSRIFGTSYTNVLPVIFGQPR